MRGSVFVFFILMVAANAAYLNVKEPVPYEGRLENDTIFIGTAGPGQTVYLVAERATIDATGEKINYVGWDTLAVEDVPPGWIVEDSPLYETPMKAKIRIAADAADGEYTFKAKAVDEGSYDSLGNLTINVKVTVSKEVFSIDVSPYEVEAGVGQPAVYYVDIENAGAASDTFRITSSGVPAWTFKKEVLVSHAIDVTSPARKTVTYEVVSEEENRIEMTLNVTSLSSDQISKGLKIVLVAEPSLVSDYKATGHGLLVSPLIESPIYSLIAFFSKLLL
ncbi:MAG: hypothetical protein NT130_00720 [Candidatus Micrarchaeota archaeon]|nr:hypothetical protein [Candidatus Micrarchaeota archaeon]